MQSIDTSATGAGVYREWSSQYSLHPAIGVPITEEMEKDGTINKS
jgi:hypothetical protein